MKKRGFRHEGITNDIDVLLFGEDFEEFFNRLSEIIPNLKWTFSNGLYRIYYKDVPFVDLIVLEHYTDTDDEKVCFDTHILKWGLIPLRTTFIPFLKQMTLKG